jgi:hypothetical protein
VKKQEEKAEDEERGEKSTQDRAVGDNVVVSNGM